MQIIALQEYTDKYISLYEGQIRNISNQLGQRLIEKGIVAEHDESSGGSSSGSNSLIVTFTQSWNDLSKFTTDHTVKEIYQAIKEGKQIVTVTGDFYFYYNMYHVSEACKYENDSYSITFTTDVAYTRDTNTLEYTLLSASRVQGESNIFTRENIYMSI